jgi:hypothetical protein
MGWNKPVSENADAVQLEWACSWRLTNSRRSGKDLAPYSYMEIQLHGHCIRMTRANQKSLDIWFHLHGNIPVHWTHKRVNLCEALVQVKRCVVNAVCFGNNFSQKSACLETCSCRWFWTSLHHGGVQMIYVLILWMFHGNCAKTTRTNWEFELSIRRRSCFMKMLNRDDVWLCETLVRPIGPVVPDKRHKIH